MMDYYYCAYCSGIVGNSDEAVSCDLCSKWQHRICDTGWHHRLNHKAGRSNLQLYVLLPLLLREGKQVDLQYQMVSEGALSRHRRAVYVDMDARIAEYWGQYDHRDITCEEFLRHVGEIYSQKV